MMIRKRIKKLLQEQRQIKLYRYQKRQIEKRERRNIYRFYHKGELDTKIKEFDKKWTKITIVISLCWVSFILLTLCLSSFLSLSDQALVSITVIASAIITEIIAVMVSYKLKAFKSKKEEEANILEREKLGITNLKETVSKIVSDVVEDTTGREG